MTSFATRLTEHGLRLPSYSGLSLIHVLPFAASLVGHHDEAHASDISVMAETTGVTSSDKVVVLLVDGLGAENLSERSGHASFLRRQLPSMVSLSCGAPSTTASSLGSFGSGRTPGQTGMLGYSIRDPHTRELANLITWESVSTPLQPFDTVFEALAASGSPAGAVGLPRFENSGLTKAALRGTSYLGVQRPEDRAAAVARQLRTHDLVYMYWGELDKVGHKQGWQSADWGHELERLDEAVVELMRQVPRGTTILITADHGMIDADPAAQVDIRDHPELTENLELVAGEPRATHVFLRPDADPSASAALWQEVLGTSAVVTTREEAINSGLFGKVSDWVVPIIGHLLVFATSCATVVDSQVLKPAAMALVGVHGSLTSRELTVPLIPLQA